jgi:hypothetical protein
VCPQVVTLRSKRCGEALALAPLTREGRKDSLLADEVLPVKRPWIAMGVSCALFVAFAIAFMAFFGLEQPILSNLFDENPYLMTKVTSSSGHSHVSYLPSKFAILAAMVGSLLWLISLLLPRAADGSRHPFAKVCLVLAVLFGVPMLVRLAAFTFTVIGFVFAALMIFAVAWAVVTYLRGKRPLEGKPKPGDGR